MSKVIASKPVTNSCSLNIYGITDEYVVLGMNDDKPRSYKLYYNTKGEPFLNYGGRRHYINEFMRTNFGS